MYDNDGTRTSYIDIDDSDDKVYTYKPAIYFSKNGSLKLHKVDLLTVNTGYSFSDVAWVGFDAAIVVHYLVDSTVSTTNLKSLVKKYYGDNSYTLAGAYETYIDNDILYCTSTTYSNGDAVTADSYVTFFITF